jgi:hypothetical protein
MVLKWLNRLICNHDFRVQPRRVNDRYHYDCYHKCGAVLKGQHLQYESTNIVAEREAGR